MRKVNKMKTPTKQQERIIQYDKNLVVLAKPGSGKTYTIAEKIKRELSNLLEFQGVIAISYTNKASDELRRRVVGSGVDEKNSFFGTISSFYISEIIYKFSDDVYEFFDTELEVISKSEDNETIKQFCSKYNEETILSDFESFINDYYGLYKMRILPLEVIDYLALYILENSERCRNYIVSRFTHCFIDEYQDCGFIQNEIFLILMKLGVIGVAVGDKDQAIYQFAKKDSKYLVELVSNPDVKLHPLDRNFRCHETIRDYSSRLLDGVTHFDSSISRVYRLRANGDEKKIAELIDKVATILLISGKIQDFSEIGILTKTENTGEIVVDYLTTPVSHYKKTPLDKNSSLLGLLFKRVLIAMNGSNKDKFELVCNYYDPDDEKKQFLKVYKYLLTFNFDIDLELILDMFIVLGKMIFSNHDSVSAFEALRKVLENESYLQSYYPPEKNRMQVMTLHKSKGLEFKVVFHLDLNEYIIPANDFENNTYKDFDEYRNLHYVGITRASDYSILVTSKIRTNSNHVKKKGNPSIFFTYNNLNFYSRTWKDFLDDIEL